MTPASLHRLRWAVRATLALGVAVSVTANVLHARHEPIAQAIAAWPPLALLITVDLVSRVPIHRRLLGAVRIGATFAIAAIAAFVSYGHMAGVTARYGETGIVPYLLPLSVDGLIIVASVSLVELAGRLRDTTPAAEATTVTGTTELDAATPAQPVTPVPASTAAQQASASANVPATTEHRPDHDHKDANNQDASEEEPANQPQPGPADTGNGNGRLKARPQRSETEQVPQRPYLVPPGLAPDLVPLLSAARQARDELLGEDRAVTRDALAARLRANGHPIRTTRVTELLSALKTEPAPANSRRPPPASN